MVATSREGVSVMRNATKRSIRVVTVLSVLALWAPSVSAAPVTNGGFEAGNLTGWTVENQPGGDGDWYVYSGMTTPENAFPIPAPPEGTFAAVTDQGGPGSHALFRDLALEAGANHTLTFVVYYNTQAGDFSTPDTLDYTVSPNQQYRVDLIRPSAPVFSVAPADVLLPIFRTDPGEPLSLPPTAMSVDLTPFAGQTVRLRFAQVDNQLFFNAAVDNVAITTSATCLGKPVTIFGTNGADSLVGTSGADVILANAGDDTIKAGPGKDRVCAGDGNDTVSGAGGKDQIDGGTGNDQLKGKGGNDRLLGRTGNDNLNGGAGRKDTCKGGPGTDVTTKCERGRA
jgi:Ca2+-binding RTX toxin-like protein